MIKRKIFNKTEIIKKFLLTNLIIILLSFSIFSTKSLGFASLITSILKNPAATYIVGVIDDINLLLAGLFNIDGKVDETKNVLDDTWSAIKDIVDDDTDGDTFFEKISNKFEKAKDDLGSAYQSMFDLLLSPDDIFSGKVQITDANIFSDKYDENGSFEVSDLNFFNIVMKNIKKVTARFYYSLRNLALVIALVMLIYTGIRIILSTNRANEKAKWQMYIFDWLKTIALIMTIHYIMIFIFYVSDTLTTTLNKNFSSEHTIVSEIRFQFETEGIFDKSSMWIEVILYAYVTYLSIVFLIAYFKRLYLIMILTILSPIFSVMYSMGKFGKRNFETFLKEYIAGILVQPYHLLVYSVLLIFPVKLMAEGSTGGFIFDFSMPSVQVYALISIAMIRPTERFLRKLFGLGATSLDNVASFESGKKTLDTGIQITKKVVETGVKVAVGVATAGAGTAALGAAKGASSLAGVAGKMSGALGNMGGTLGNMGQNAMNALGKGTGLGENLGNSLLKGDSALLNEANNILSEDNSLMSLKDDLLTNGASPEDMKAYDELYNEQQNRKANFADDIIHGIDDTNENDKASQLLDDPNAKDNDSLDVLNVNNLISKNTQNDNVANNGPMDNNLLLKDNQNMNGENEEENQNDSFEENDDKQTLDGGTLANALLGRLENAYNRVQDSPLLAPDMRDSYLSIRSAAHEFVDSFYIANDAPRDWHTNIEAKKEYLNQKKEDVKNNFINSKENQQEAVRIFNLKDKVDKNTGETISAESQAKQKLESMVPYRMAGLTNVQVIADLQQRKVAPQQAYKQILSDNIASGRYQSYVKSEKNIQQLQTIVAGRMGKLAEFKSGDTNIVQQVNQSVAQTIEGGRSYITSGQAKDAETLMRLTDLERKIDKNINMGGGAGYSKQDYVVKADSIIEKAIKKEIKEIKLPKPQGQTQSAQLGKKATAELEKIMNTELKERRSRIENSPSTSGRTESAQRRIENTSGRTESTQRRIENTSGRTEHTKKKSEPPKKLNG